MPVTLADVELDLVARRQLGQELGTLDAGGADLEVERRRGAERARPKQRAAQVGGPAAGTSDDA